MFMRHTALLSRQTDIVVLQPRLWCQPDGVKEARLEGVREFLGSLVRVLRAKCQGP